MSNRLGPQRRLSEDRKSDSESERQKALEKLPHHQRVNTIRTNIEMTENASTEQNEIVEIEMQDFLITEKKNLN